jgi:hypothetical protein
MSEFVGLPRTDNTNKSKNELKAGAIAGIAVGGFVVSV